MRKIRYSSLALAAVVLCQGAVALAESGDEDELALVYGDKSTVSIATGSQQALRRAPAVATVITAEDIAAMGATNVDDVLETVPGLHVIHSASMNATNYSIRGVYSQFTPQVLMLQNGIPVTVALTGNKGSLWGGLPVENIARIEVIRGPGSALYGADAFSGVVNVITKTAADTAGTQVGVRVGSQSAKDAWVQHGGNLGPVDVAAYLRVGGTDGFKRNIDADAQSLRDPSRVPGPVNSGYDAVDGGLDLAYGQFRWRAGYKLRNDMGTFAGLGSAVDPVGRGRSERISTDISWTETQLTDNLSVTADAAFMRYEQTFPTQAQISPPGTTFPTGTFVNGMIGAPEFAERQMRASAAATYTGFADQRVRFGLGHDDLDLYQTREYKNFVYSATGVPTPNGPVVDSVTPFIRPHQRRVDYLYAQDEWSFARDWTLTAGLRRDVYSDAGGTTNPRLALVWDTAQNLTTKLLYGQAFRAPSFTEQYAENNPIARGYAGLKPEKTRTLEAAVAWQAAPSLQVNVNVFHYNMRDIIRAAANKDGSPGTTFTNTGAQNGKGLELETVWDAGRNLRLSGNYSYQRSIDEATTKDAGYAPHHHLYLRGDWRFSETWLASTQVNWVADRKRAAGDTRPDIPDYTTVDLTLRTNHGRGQWDFAGSIRNLFKADVREPSLAPGTALPDDLPMAPRTLYVQAIYKL
jgi:iron complex outermembrane receptor protein